MTATTDTTAPRLKVRYREEISPALREEFSFPNIMQVPGLTKIVALEDDGSVLVEANVGAVGTPTLLLGTDDDGLDDLALLHAATGDGVLDRAHDDITDACVTTARATEDPDDKDLLGTGVVGDSKSRLLLNHCILLIVCRFSREPGGTLVVTTWPFRGSRPRASAWSQRSGASP